ncbi:MAG: hypothetical protein DESF_00619 [Desulfovibrio sp.]
MHLRYARHRAPTRISPHSDAKTAKLSSDNLAVLFAMWRRGRDLNSRYRFKPVYSLSRRAPSADSDTSPRATDAAAPRMQKRNLAQDRIPVKRMNIIVPHLIAPGGRLRSAAAPHHRPAGRSAPHSTASTCPHTTAPHNRCTRRPYDAHTGHCSARSANRTPLPYPLPNLPVSVTSSRKPVVEQWPSLWSPPSTVQLILADAQSAISRSRSPAPRRAACNLPSDMHAFCPTGCAGPQPLRCLPRYVGPATPRPCVSPHERQAQTMHEPAFIWRISLRKEPHVDPCPCLA